MDLSALASRFALRGAVTDVRPLGEGFINDTYCVFVDGASQPAYILQRKNHLVFPDVPAMMENIVAVTRHIKGKVADPERGTLTVVPALDGRWYVQDEGGNFWAVCTFIQGSKSYERADTPELARQGGLGLGLFHRQVADFTQPLTEIIKGFHNIRFRFAQWDEALRRDAAGRVASLQEEIGWIESRRARMLAFWERFEKGEIPTRATHNDTKISNFLFDAKTGEVLCAIDLDTLMSSTLLNDVGDALRSYTNSGAEDDPDLAKVSMSMPFFRAYMEGYLSQMAGELAPIEIEYLAFSGLYITYEQVLRFLMDYIDGDTYYKTRYPEHNLVRTRAQYKLLTSMEEQLPEMNALVQQLVRG
ncbi:MAG: aminoglycoside phosphotransferase family protein [Bacteroidales bacterium]|nr:aminoglycoside phosphotransferase family protein [Bacteroidales bacterium]